MWHETKIAPFMLYQWLTIFEYDHAKPTYATLSGGFIDWYVIGSGSR